MGARRHVERACAKLSFTTLVKARWRAMLETRRHGVKHYIYPCPACREWHMTTTPGPDALDVVPHFTPTDKGPGRDRGEAPTSTLLVLRWYHGTLAQLGDDAHGAAFRKVDRHLRKRGVL
jgi:hypothetical protein